MPELQLSLEAALAFITRFQATQGSRGWRLAIRKTNPGGLTAHQTTEVQGIQAGFDWEAGQLILEPAHPLTELTPEEVEDIRKSSKAGQSWHAYQREKKLLARIAELEAELTRQQGLLQEAEARQSGPLPLPVPASDPNALPSWLPLGRTRMYVCSICGNKRCPRAENLAFLCSSSNELGQVGVLAPVEPGSPPPVPTQDQLDALRALADWGQEHFPDHYGAPPAPTT